MPELPEVETIRAQLADRIPGRTMTKVEVHDPKLVEPEDPQAVAEALAGRGITEVGRRGKYLLIGLDDGDTLAIHLRMTGRLHWRPPGEEGEERFLRARFTLDDGSTLTFGDMRRFGRAWIVPAGPASEREAYWAERVGIEPLTPQFTARVLEGLLAGRRGPLDHDEIRRLHRAIRDRLAAAVAAGGASIDSYRDSLGERGTMQDLLRVHLHQGDPCPRCRTPIVKTRVAQRGTYWCPTCQPEPARW